MTAALLLMGLVLVSFSGGFLTAWAAIPSTAALRREVEALREQNNRLVGDLAAVGQSLELAELAGRLACEEVDRLTTRLALAEPPPPPSPTPPELTAPQLRAARKRPSRRGGAL